MNKDIFLPVLWVTMVIVLVIFDLDLFLAIHHSYTATQSNLITAGDNTGMVFTSAINAPEKGKPNTDTGTSLSRDFGPTRYGSNKIVNLCDASGCTKMSEKEWMDIERKKP